MKRSSALYLLLAASLAVPGTAFSQWQWKDANGRTVYSDVPPPPSVPDRAILSAPGRVAGAYRPLETETKGEANSPAGAPRMQATGTKTAQADADKAFRERRDARIKADLEAATKERAQLARQEKCQEMRNYATGLSGGTRVAKIGADGALNRLGGEEREAELARVNEQLAQNCAS